MRCLHPTDVANRHAKGANAWIAAGSGSGIENLRFNASIARLMELANALTPLEQRPRSVVQSLMLLLAPLRPISARSCGASSAWQIAGLCAVANLRS